MRKCEVLSPAGDLKSFYRAIESGADAIYMGLNKFNARMKAENVGLENLAEVVRHAHMKDVCVYVTVNTLLSDSEIPQMVDMVGKCLEAGVDAFIVQDYGVIGVLRAVYPNIVLHGSTQLGVHNVRGARVAKALGLSRVVLSRECDYFDIREIAENVDIELEVFVQGALCVCFSGNCYMSSLKHNASGNRGLCKQLCRLPYSLIQNPNEKAKPNYALSPRDNCMLDYLDELINLGVCSFKIEGRLRRDGYVAVATRVYRECIDDILAGRTPNIESGKVELKKVFSRGEFVPAYFRGSNIISTQYNNHMGQEIGTVKSVSRFKDLFKIIIQTDVELHANDGLKFVFGDRQESIGVGNVEKQGKDTMIFSKTQVSSGAKVFRLVDAEFEALKIDKSRYRKVDFSIGLFVGNKALLRAVSSGHSVEVSGNIVQEAKSRPITVENIQAQLSKVGKDYWEIGEINVDMVEDVFLPMSEINELRRQALAQLEEKILSSFVSDISPQAMPSKGEAEPSLTRLCIVDIRHNLKDVADYDGIILSPSEYSLEVVEKFYQKFAKTHKKLLVNLPIIAMAQDLKKIDKVVDYCKEKKMAVVCNNIYGLNYIESGVEVWAGSNMNIVNGYAVRTLNDLGVTEIIGSVENWTTRVAGTYKLNSGKRVLMTLATCPHKTLGVSCEDGTCPHKSDMILKDNASTYALRRIKVVRCYFELVDTYSTGRGGSNIIDDLR